MSKQKTPLNTAFASAGKFQLMISFFKNAISQNRQPASIK